MPVIGSSDLSVHDPSVVSGRLLAPDPAGFGADSFSCFRHE